MTRKFAYLISAFVFFATALSAVAQAPDQDAKQEADLRARDLREIEQLEARWNMINEVSDAAGKAELLSDDSYHVGPSGRLYNKQQDIDAMITSRRQKDQSNSMLKFLISGMKIRLYTDVAVVTATGRSITTRDGQQRPGGSFRVVHVWEKVDGRWYLAVDQVTSIAN
jgi:uncharacterized protein (TIGR02246 family)